MPCTKCAEDKPLAKANKSKSTGEQLYRTICVDCEKQRKADYVKINKEQHNKKSKQWATNNTEKRKEIRNKSRAKNKEKANLATALWRSKNKSRVNIHTAMRRKRIQQATPRWSNKEDLICIYQEAQYLQLEVDHIIPLNNPLVCGLHVANNLQLLTKSQNSSKGNSYAIE